MLQALACEFLTVEMAYVSLLTSFNPVVIVTIGASRIYRGLVDLSSPSHREAQASSKCWDKLQPEAGKERDSDIV